ncbi:hypothetical protein P153DRAFT_434587 [Dothidotthia symphoricarpi CBS 119687]|uniref:RING-type domain-containing protein n=1 Tax=Dothidotthia symphoricarpi CBS 119687 TaxID=1392245 RepID=A0A6A6A4N9_9PLEO|nr:uncharacterized protein P153DRAFT_434587 [Dothidotthia symphoricarpi CBS 119687]KAF2125561.1 hypothetical protein P153DRAFT_434587 [Dothidotthia symphoricarpi CBS 119687]
MEEILLQSMNAPASATVYQHVRLRLRNLKDLRKLLQEHETPKSLLEMSCEDVHRLGKQHFPPSSSGFRLAIVTDEDAVLEEARQARDWLSGMLACHEKLLSREHLLRMFRLAIEKDMAGQKERWSEKEKLYMVLTDPKLVTLEDRLKAAFTTVLHLNLAQQLQHVGEKAQVRFDRVERTEALTAQTDDIRDSIVVKARNVKVDHFACAAPLSLLTSQTPAEEIACPICQNSHTDMRTFTIPDLLADYPVRIKYCGHFVGKACLEQWMMTPKIEAAKYPHRTCPLCRVKIEGVDTPALPVALRKHVVTDWRAMEVLREMEEGWEMEVDECLDAVVACMSEEVAVEEMLAEVARRRMTSKWGFESEEKILRSKLEELRKEKWVWGFRGDAIWRRLRDEWVGSGIVRKD